MGLLKSIAVLAIASGVAHGDPVVLAIDGKDIFVGLGAKDGVGAGSQLELQHEVIAKDPRSGTTLRDHFALGTIEVMKAGDGVCVARADGELAKRVLAGDHVRLISAKKTFVDPWAEQVLASKANEPDLPGVPAPDHVALARAAWQDTLGKSPEQRIERWKALLAADTATPYRKPIAAEIKSLEAQIAAREAALARQKAKHPDERDPRIIELTQKLDPRPGALVLAPIDRAAPGQPLELAFVARSPASIAQAWLFVRSAGDTGFHRIELARDGDAYLRGTIGAALMHGAAIEWYAEAAAPESPSGPVLGTQQAPNVLAIDRDVHEAPIYPARSQITLHFDYVDFQGKQSDGYNYDEYYQAEADFQYRFIDPIYAVRLGFGTLSGIGGKRGDIDNPAGVCLDGISGKYACKRVSFNYVYTELEHEITPAVHVMIRPQIGQLATNEIEHSTAAHCRDAIDTTGCRFQIGFGGHSRVRFGSERGTNLALGAGWTRGVGTLLEAAYQWLPTPVMPVHVAVQVTDQPVNESPGVRLIGDLGLRSLSWVYPSLRVSYQARSLQHSGVSGGFGLNFDW